MLLPTKHLPANRSLIFVGGELLSHLDVPKTVSRLWEDTRLRMGEDATRRISYDWFILALDFLFIIGSVILTDGLLARTSP